MQSGSWVFCCCCLCVSFVQNLPQLCIQLFLVLYGFLAFCCFRRCLSRYKHCSTAVKDPRSQAFLKMSCGTLTLNTASDFLCIGIFCHYGHQKEKSKLSRCQTLPRHEHHYYNQDLIIISSSCSRPNKIQLLTEM